MCAGEARTGLSLLGKTRADLTVLTPAAGEKLQSRQTEGILKSPCLPLIKWIINKAVYENRRFDP